MKAAIGLVLASLLVLPAGCGGGNGPKTIDVRGQITHKGQALASGTITFAPVDPNVAGTRPAVGAIKDGLYRLSTFSTDDGTLPGQYVVIVQSHGRPASELDRRPKSLIPEQFASHAKTPLRAIVPADHRGTLKLDFDLK